VTIRAAGRLFAASLVLFVLAGVAAFGQTAPAAAAPAATPAPARPPEDALGRTTPRGTLLAFLAAARKEDGELSSQYLNTRLKGVEAQELARQLYVVLDARLPARLTLVSDAPEGSRGNPLAPNQDVIGTVADKSGQVPIVVERITPRGQPDPIWLFSSQTLEAVPELYEEILQSRSRALLPRFLTHNHVGGIPLFEWLALLAGLPAIFLVTGLLNRLLKPVVRLFWRRVLRNPNPFNRDPMPRPARLLLLAVATRWLLTVLPLSLLLRQFWANVAILLTITSLAWLLMVLGGDVETILLRRLPSANTAAIALLRVGRRVVDVLVVFTALFAVLRHFGIDPTPALAGLGVGGIAVALAAQKTLENVIAGASLIFDQAVKVGDFLKIGEIEGTVDHIGLRSTRIRTPGRTVVSVPNSQIASVSLETLSARDKFWFHPVVGLRYETTGDQMQIVLAGIRSLLARHPSVEGASVRVRLVRLGASSLDVEVFAYVLARDWAHFLELQEGLLLRITEIVAAAGAELAFPTQTIHVANAVSEAGAGTAAAAAAWSRNSRRAPGED